MNKISFYNKGKIDPLPWELYKGATGVVISSGCASGRGKTGGNFVDMSRHSVYIENIFNDELREDSLDWFSRKLYKFRGKYDGFVGTGLSGLFAIFLAEKLNKGFAILRKSGVNDHRQTSLEVSSKLEGKTRLLVVDDLVSSGKTLRNINDNVFKDPRHCFTFEGLLLYNSFAGKPILPSVYKPFKGENKLYLSMYADTVTTY